jgi:hypothetical protein
LFFQNPSTVNFLRKARSKAEREEKDIADPE